MENAVGMMNIMLEEKTVWNAKVLQDRLFEIYTQAQYTTTSMQKVFGYACHNFEVYVSSNDVSSIGRNEFKKWMTTELRYQAACVPTCEDTAQPEVSETERLRLENEELKKQLELYETVKDLAARVEAIERSLLMPHRMHIPVRK